jgi:putative sigma-54 modulation protein
VAAPGRTGARVVRGRPSAVKPMGVDEAALAMESSGQEVLVFRDASNEKISVLYRRRDGDLGLIVPE